MDVKKARETIEKFYRTYRLVLSEEKKEILNNLVTTALNESSTPQEVEKACFASYKLVLKREYRNVDFEGKDCPFLPKKGSWETISVSEAVKKLEGKANDEISLIFYPDGGSKYHYTTKDFDIMFYDKGSFSDTWYNVASIRKKRR